MLGVRRLGGGASALTVRLILTYEGMSAGNKGQDICKAAYPKSAATHTTTRVIFWSACMTQLPCSCFCFMSSCV